ncbi:Organelle rrm domain-containing protein 2 protein [Thalictrum thalictroides]|uniref:Organelle rrm domain-containing protein 2 protein n=1 Tax=Thalictrum thalictroides TaxID=46969 RepID=A0A7J6WXX9_THATH|nr:Organelle rrm domain-containing protein 2 protein [Thalictrum thalictroides]
MEDGEKEGRPLLEAATVKIMVKKKRNEYDFQEDQGLSKRTTSEGLREAFAQFGQVIYARIVTDRNSGYSKGFGFVRYATLEDAAKGIEGMDGKFLDGWVIFAEYARPRPQHQPQEYTGSPISSPSY